MLCVWVNLKILTCVECFKEIQKYIKKPFPLTSKEVRVYTCIFDNVFRKLVLSKRDGTQNRKWKKRFLRITVHCLWCFIRKQTYNCACSKLSFIKIDYTIFDCHSTLDNWESFVKKNKTKCSCINVVRSEFLYFNSCIKHFRKKKYGIFPYLQL